MIDAVFLKTIFATCLIIPGYYAYHFLSDSKKVSNWFSNRYTYERSEIYRFFYQKITGFVLLGVLPGILFFHFFELSTEGYSIVFFTDNLSWFSFYALLGVILIVTFFSAKAKEVNAVVPVMRLRNWKIIHLTFSMFGWGLYLLAYEFIFRQMLLFSWTEAYGSYTAILVNVIIYAVFHIPKGKLETLGSIPFGIVLCLVSLHAGTFLPAFLLHFALAVSTELFSIYHNSQMKVSFKLMGND